MNGYNRNVSIAESYLAGRGNDAFRFIVLSHIKSIVSLMSHDLYGGIWVDRPVYSGASISSIKSYMKCGKSAVVNAVRVLDLLCAPTYDIDMRSKKDAFVILLDELKERRVETDKDVFKDELFELYLELFEFMAVFFKRENYYDVGV